MGRGGRLDAHERRLYLVFRLACEVADSRRDFQARAQNARGESLGLRRVIPSPKERHRIQKRPHRVCVRPSPKKCSSYSKTLRISVRCKCTPPTRPIREYLYIGRSCDTHHYFVKETRRKILHGKSGKNFRALDNDVKLKLKNCGRHFLPSALIT